MKIEIGTVLKSEELGMEATIENDKQVEFFQLVSKLSSAYSRVRSYFNENSTKELLPYSEMIGPFFEAVLFEHQGELKLDLKHLANIGVGKIEMPKTVKRPEMTLAELEDIPPVQGSQFPADIIHQKMVSVF